MFPIGKLTLAVLGLRLWGADGFFWGMFLGHIFIDRTLIRKRLKQYLSTLDDNIRLLLPYRFYKYYNRLEGNMFGFIWGTILGGLTYGFSGFLIFTCFGYFVFNMPNNHWSLLFKSSLETFWNRNWCKLLGAIIGFSLNSNFIIFIGVIIGFFVDYLRLNGFSRQFNLNFIYRFWSRINLMKLYLHSSDAKKFAFVQAMAGLSAKISKADGIVSENEIRTFKKMFELTYEQNSKIAAIYNDAKQNTEGYERYAKQLHLIVGDNLDLKENIIDNLFKIAAADGVIHKEQLDILKNVAYIIELSNGNFDLIYDNYNPRPGSFSSLQDYYKILDLSATASNDEIKSRWKELINQWHPDRAQSQGAKTSEIEQYTLKMAEINNAYQHIMKSRLL